MCTEQPRFSVFGWFLQPGQLYKLFQGDDAHHGCQDTGADINQPKSVEVHDTGADNLQQKPVEAQQTVSCQTFCGFADADAHATADVGMYSMRKKQYTLLSPYANSPHGLSTLLASKTLPDRQKRLSRLKAA